MSFIAGPFLGVLGAFALQSEKSMGYRSCCSDRTQGYDIEWNESISVALGKVKENPPRK